MYLGKPPSHHHQQQQQLGPQLPPPSLTQKYKENFDKWMYGGYVRDDELNVGPAVGICVGADAADDSDVVPTPTNTMFTFLRYKFVFAALGDRRELATGRHGLLRFLSARLTRRVDSRLVDVAGDVERCIAGGLVNDKLVNPLDEWVRDGMMAEWIRWAHVDGDDVDKRDLIGAGRALKSSWAQFRADFHDVPVGDADASAALERMATRRHDVDIACIQPRLHARFTAVINESQEGLQAQARRCNAAAVDACLAQLRDALGPAHEHCLTGALTGSPVGMSTEQPFKLKNIRAAMIYLVRLARIVVLATLTRPVFMHVTKADIAQTTVVDSVDMLLEIVKSGNATHWAALNRFQQLHAAVLHVCLRGDLHSLEAGRALFDIIESTKPVYSQSTPKQPSGDTSSSESDGDGDGDDGDIGGGSGTGGEEAKPSCCLDRVRGVPLAAVDAQAVITQMVFNAPVEFGETWPQRVNNVEGVDITPYFQLSDCVASGPTTTTHSPRIHKEKYDDKSIATSYHLHYTAQTDDKFESVVCTGTPSVPMLMSYLDADASDAHVFAAVLDERRSRMWQFNCSGWVAAMGGSNPLPDAVMDKTAFTGSVQAAVWWLLLTKMLTHPRLFSCASQLCELVVCHVPEVQVVVLWALFTRLGEAEGVATATGQRDVVKEDVLRTLFHARDVRPVTQLCILQRLEMVARLRARSLVSLSNLSLFHSTSQFRDVGVIVRKRSSKP